MSFSYKMSVPLNPIHHFLSLFSYLFLSFWPFNLSFSYKISVAHNIIQFIISSPPHFLLPFVPLVSITCISATNFQWQLIPSVFLTFLSSTFSCMTFQQATVFHSGIRSHIYLGFTSFYRFPYNLSVDWFSPSFLSSSIFFLYNP